MNDRLKKMMKQIPLNVRVKVGIITYFIVKEGGTLFMPLDKDGNDIPEALEANNKCYALAQPVLEKALEIIKEWKEDKTIPLEKRIETLDKEIQDIILEGTKEWEDDGCPEE